MKRSPLVTIVTPSYNQGRFIQATIESVLSQDYSNIEYLVIDGGSTDNTIEILKSYGDKIKWISEKDEGQSDAINKGFKLAQGEIVAWLNSDDTYEPGAVKTAVEYFLDHKKTALVYGEGDIIDEKGNKVKRFGATQKFDLWTLIHVWDYIMQPTTFFLKTALDSVGYLNKELNWCMDWDLWIRIACEYDVGYINKVLANSREYADTKTSTGGFKRLKEIVALMRKYGNMKYPPGYFLYGGSTFVTLTERIPIVNFIVKGIVHILHKKIFSNLPVLFSDGWAGKRLSIAVNSNCNRISIMGNVFSEEVIPLKITAFNEKRKFIKEIELDKTGEFEMDISLQKKYNGLKWINLNFNKTFNPSYSGKNDDNRNLSVRIKNYYYKLKE